MAESVKRRRLLKAMSVATATSVAGCSASDEPNDDNGSDGNNGGNKGQEANNVQDEPGERVPSLTLSYFANRAGYTKTQEDTMPTLVEAGEAIGATVEPTPVEFTTMIDNTINDQRTTDWIYVVYSLSPGRLDPDAMTRWWAIDWAGGNGRNNFSNWANCDYSMPALQQKFASNEKEREQLINEAHSILTDEFPVLPVAGVVSYTAARTDNVTPNRLGQGKFYPTNVPAYIYTEPTSGDSYTAAGLPSMVETTNFPTSSSLNNLTPWTHLIHSPLLEYDENYELQNCLASNYEVNNDFQQVVVELADATFHNGDSVTAEDVKFTFDYLQNNRGSFPYARDLPLDSIEVVDDKTVEFNLEEAFPTLVTISFQRWGILHKQTWEEGGARENPQSFEFDPAIGSGPFELTDIELGQAMKLEPHDGHPVHESDTGIVFRAYRNSESMTQSIQSGELDVAISLSLSQYNDVQERSNIEAYVTEGFAPWTVHPQCPKPPNKFTEFRHAFGRALNRQKLNELAFQGNTFTPMDATPILENHPWRPPEDQITKYTDDIQGDPEGARQVLEDAGWGWDDNGNLRYPADADLSPVWPEGETPSEEDFPCMDDLPV